MLKNKPKIFESKIFFIVVFLISALLLFTPILFDLNIKDFTSLGLIGVALLNFLSASTLFFPTPGFLATGFAGSLYNPLLVALASAIGSTLGEGVGFAFGYSTEKISNFKKHKILITITRIIHGKYGYLLIILLSFIPNPFFDVVGIIAGISSYPLRKFLVLVFIGRFVRDLIVAWVGSTIA